ncbi:hybrid histidine protein kinase/response regulator SinK [Pyxidicoccus fallax]|uniref:histidine kinase n=1 Tax=Pyxidicoccus fallax TaxID=394095 RepID=A0A848LXC9_9BACT|nr:hybrid histidine protein kinase/response regulator SinK [Pyxidicoccus fallax]NMO22260.1 hybrid histidine protein kinase/response regulator SinK [Pyxidicoccus fallax]NPC83922.1 hybrid histidine protein kinase/response regulator SinK [Pyxidicoccus fallax]
METPAPLSQLLQALEAGDLPAARAAAAALQRAGAHSAQLAAEVLHELRQPLLGVKAYAQLLAEDGGPTGPLRLLLAQVERMEQIVSDYIRLASERHAPQQRLSLAAPIWAAAKLFSVNPDSARMSLEVEAPEDITIQGNARLIEQLTLNLLNNARDAMAGRGRVKVVLSREGASPVLYVADWGPGIPVELRERIFEPYVTANKRGTGLGLAVCKRIAQEHNATIGLAAPGAIRDVPPPATVFRVLFPATDAPPQLRKRLLVVDDETIIRMVFRDLMGKECEVIEAASGEEALDLLRQAPVDLIVTDKNLPGLSGLELAQQARRLYSNSRVILMTGYPSLVTTQQALELGVVDYLLKPFDDIRQVRGLLRTTLSSEPPVPPVVAPGAEVRRVDVLEDNPTTARLISEALDMLGLEARVLPSTELMAMATPVGVVVSWDFAPAYGRKALELAKALAQGAPFVVLAEHLTMETALESLRAGAAACLPKLLSDTTALSRELSRAFKREVP